MQIRYVLDKSSRKAVCPNCNKNTFVLYIDTETNEYLPDEYGRCDREQKCGYHNLAPLETKCFLVPFENIKDLTEKAVLISQNEVTETIPKSAIFEQLESGLYVSEYFLLDYKNKRTERLKISYSQTDYKYFSKDEGGAVKVFKGKGTTATNQENKTVYFDFETFSRTLKAYEKNVFLQNLIKNVPFPFVPDEVAKVVNLYALGTIANGYRAGAICLPFIDVNGNVRAVQVKAFDKANHTTETGFLHSMIEAHYKKQSKPLPDWLQAYLQQEKRVSCLFGEHLLKVYPNNPIALVEAPKTAIYGALYFGLPQTPESLIWLAVYNKSSFSFDKLKVLQGRKVLVFPDLSNEGETFKEWQNKAKDFEKRLIGTRFIFSDLLEQLATPEQKAKGADLADVLIQMDWRKFRTETQTQTPPPETPRNNETNEFDRLKAEFERTNFEIERITNRIAEIRNLIAWQNNRSRQANTIIKRGF
jgi:hypothetical protein